MTREQAIKEMKETGALAVMRYTKRIYLTPLPRPDMKIDLMPYTEHIDEYEYRIAKDWEELEIAEECDWSREVFNKESRDFQRWLGMPLFPEDKCEVDDEWEVEVK